MLFRGGIKEIKIWILAGISGAIPVALYIHKQLHLVESFIGEKSKKIDELLRKV